MFSGTLKIANRVWKGALGFWALPSTLAKDIFDPSTPSMRKGHGGGEKGGGEEKKEIRMMKIVATNVIASWTDWNADRSCQYSLFYPWDISDFN